MQKLLNDVNCKKLQYNNGTILRKLQEFIKAASHFTRKS